MDKTPHQGNYLALDMQKAAINTCQERHENRGKKFIEKLVELENSVQANVTHPAPVAVRETPKWNQLRAQHKSDNPSLQCQLIPNGVGHISKNDNALASAEEPRNGVPRDTNSVDFVVISETHIADMEIGDLEKAIFKEIKRVLKPGGLFLWGNALPTKVWFEAMDYLPKIGFELVF